MEYPRDRSRPSHLYQVEIEIGLTPHIQIDIYENMHWVPGQGVSHEGNQIEMRYSIANTYGAIWGNPTLYLEWHPRHNAPDRAEGRLLIGGQPLPHLFAAANAYYEQNVETGTPSGADGETGLQAAASYGIRNDTLRFGAELKAGIDQHGENSFKAVTLVGPHLLVKFGRFKLTATAFFGLQPGDPRLMPFVIAGYGF